jgi:hypothetical protein
MEEKQQSKLPIVGLVLMTLAAAVLGYLYFDKKQLADQKETTIIEKVKELAFTQTKLDSVSTALDAQILMVKQLGGKVDDLMAVKARLEADKADLKKMTSLDMTKLNAKIKEYDVFLANKDVDINKLKEENGMLTASNQTLITTNKTLSTDVESLKVAKTIVTKAFSDSMTVFTARTKDLSDKVSIGASLKAENVHVVAVFPNGKVKDKENYKANRVDKIKVLFSLPENQLTKLEPKEIMLRVLDPDGAILSDAAIASGKFTFKGQEMVYTAKNTVTYQNNNQAVEMVYDNTENFRAGRYSVELYSEGFKIGSGSFAIK